MTEFIRTSCQIEDGNVWALGDISLKMGYRVRRVHPPSRMDMSFPRWHRHNPTNITTTPTPSTCDCHNEGHQTHQGCLGDCQTDDYDTKSHQGGPGKGRLLRSDLLLDLTDGRSTPKTTPSGLESKGEAEARGRNLPRPREPLKGPYEK